MIVSEERTLYKVIDLFSGAGGLSLGFQQTNKFNIKVAFENNPNMQETYKYNHPSVEVRGDVCNADYTEIKHKYGDIDVVIGGPPCQGFSNANRQKNHAISQNNMLVKQYLRAVLELQPKAFVMENVSMLRSDVHRFYLEHQDKHIVEKYKIPVKNTTILLLEESYIFEGAAEIAKDFQQAKAFMWPEDHYLALNIVFKAAKNPTKLKTTLKKHKDKLLKYSDIYLKEPLNHSISIISNNAFSAIASYYNENFSVDKIQSEISQAIMVQRMLRKIKEIADSDLVVDNYEFESGISAVVQSYAVFDYLYTILSSHPNNYSIDEGVLCAADFGAPQKRKRFVLMGIKNNLASEVKLPRGSFSEDTYRTVYDAIADLEDEIPVNELTQDVGVLLGEPQRIMELSRELRDSSILQNHIITKTTSTAMERFRALKQGQNFHSLDDALKTNTYSDISRTQNTIYLRLNYDKPCGTVTNVRKSMWIHPTKDRAISVREAARLQTFPDSFRFLGTKDKQYQQVGNAVPPILAKSIANSLALQLISGLEKAGNAHGRLSHT